MIVKIGFCWLWPCPLHILYLFTHLVFNNSADWSLSKYTASQTTVYTTATIRNYVLFEMEGGSNSLIYPHFSFMPFVNFDIKKFRTSHVRKSLCLHTKDDYWSIKVLCDIKMTPMHLLFFWAMYESNRIQSTVQPNVICIHYYISQTTTNLSV